MRYLLLAVLLSSSAANAATEFANINQGDVRVGGSLGVGYSTYSSTIVSVNPYAQYFFADNVAAGLDVDMFFSNNESSYGVGPVLSYYFWNSEKWAAYIEQKFKYFTSEVHDQSLLKTDPYWRTYTTLGANYFFAPYAALGPAFTYSRYLTGEHYDSQEGVFDLTANFSIYF
jgi:hypothetical protein